MMNLQQVCKDSKLYKPYFTDKDKAFALEAYYDQEDGMRTRELLKQWSDTLMKEVNPVNYNVDIHIQYYGKDFLPRKSHVRSIQHGSQIAKRRFRRNKKLFLKKTVIKEVYPISIGTDWSNYMSNFSSEEKPLYPGQELTLHYAHRR